MQYGNPWGSDGGRPYKEFKSYYVVWKLEYSNIGETQKIEFKSYYVVWKLKHKTEGNEYGKIV